MGQEGGGGFATVLCVFNYNNSHEGKDIRINWPLSALCKGKSVTTTGPQKGVVLPWKSSWAPPRHPPPPQREPLLCLYRTGSFCFLVNISLNRTMWSFLFGVSAHTHFRGPCRIHMSVINGSIVLPGGAPPTASVEVLSISSLLPLEERRSKGTQGSK